MVDHEKGVDEDNPEDSVVGRRLVAVKRPVHPFEHSVDRTLGDTVFDLACTGSAEGLVVQETMVWQEWQVS